MNPTLNPATNNPPSATGEQNSGSSEFSKVSISPATYQGQSIIAYCQNQPGLSVSDQGCFITELLNKYPLQKRKVRQQLRAHKGEPVTIGSHTKIVDVAKGGRSSLVIIGQKQLFDLTIKTAFYPEDKQDISQLEQLVANEITLLSALKHSNILPILGYSTPPDGLPSSIMLMPRLNDFWTAKRQLGNQISEQWCLQFCTGLAYLHSPAVSIIHRDLKGSNLLFDDDFNLKIADFGFAKKLAENTKFKTTQYVGSLPFWAPEVHNNTPPDQEDIDRYYSQSSDIYAAGLVLAELCDMYSTVNGPSRFSRGKGYTRQNKTTWMPTQMFLNQKKDELRTMHDHSLQLALEQSLAILGKELTQWLEEKGTLPDTTMIAQTMKKHSFPNAFEMKAALITAACLREGEKRPTAQQLMSSFQ